MIAGVLLCGINNELDIFIIYMFNLRKTKSLIKILLKQCF